MVTNDRLIEPLLDFFLNLIANYCYEERPEKHINW